MSLEKVLNDWKEYDRKKIKNGLDPNYFLWDESWEIHFLKTKIKNIYPGVRELTIFQAIEASCGNRTILRKDFVQKVLTKLDLYKPIDFLGLSQ
jgi:hypothetical protein